MIVNPFKEKKKGGKLSNEKKHTKKNRYEIKIETTRTKDRPAVSA